MLKKIVLKTRQAQVSIQIDVWNIIEVYCSQSFVAR